MATPLRSWRCAGWLWLFLVAVGVAGCSHAHQSAGTFHDSNMDFASIRTVAVMPFVNLTQNANAADRTRETLMTMLQATGTIYVLPSGEVARGVSRTNIVNAAMPTPEEVVAIAKNVKADAVITGSVLEYGEVRSGSASANMISMNLQLFEAQTGKIVWSADTTKGGITTSDRLFGGGGQPMNAVTIDAIDDLLDKLFAK
jgi:TolB-like protein